MGNVVGEQGVSHSRGVALENHRHKGVPALERLAKATAPRLGRKLPQLMDRQEPDLGGDHEADHPPPTPRLAILTGCTRCPGVRTVGVSAMCGDNTQQRTRQQT